MALLTADDVHYKTFTPTKFREGYDQDEVDEFLDQVVSTIVELQDRNEELKSQGGAPQAGAPVASEGSAEQAAEVEQLRSQLQAAEQRAAELQAANETLEADLVQAQKKAALEPSVQQTPVEEGQNAGDATSMLALAQRVHDEYVRNGEEEGNRIVADSRIQGEQIVREANDERQRVLEKLEVERTDLEQKVDDLKQFESEYRAQIRSHLQTLIQTVDAGADN